MSNAPVLVFGKTGQVARALSALLGSKAVLIGRDEADFTDTASFAPVIDRVQPAAIINAVAYTQVDKAEEEPGLAHQINAVAPGVLAGLAAERDIPFVHYSTDYVFNGKGDAFRSETDSCAPLNAYGKSKLAGERAVLEVGGKQLIFRTSWVYDAQGKNFFTIMLHLAQTRESLSIVDDQIGAPTYAPHIAQATMEALLTATHAQPFPGGIYHLCNQGVTSWYEFACEIFRQAMDAGLVLRIDACEAIPTSQYVTPAIRPLNSRLDCSKLERTFDVSLPHWRDGLEEALTHYMQQHIEKGEI